MFESFSKWGGSFTSGGDQNEGRRLEHFAFFYCYNIAVSAKKSFVCAFAKGFAVADEEEVRE